MRNTLAKGGAACRPLVAEGLSAAFIEPALRYPGDDHGTVVFGKRLREIEFASGHVHSFKFNDSEISVGEGENVILAVPPWVRNRLCPG